jgi:hypothetical protein
MGGRDVMKEGVMEADVVELNMAKWEFETGGCVYIYFACESLTEVLHRHIYAPYFLFMWKFKGSFDHDDIAVVDKGARFACTSSVHLHQPIL